MTGYLLVGVAVAAVMGVGIVLARRVEAKQAALAMIFGAIGLSVVVWMALSESLQLRDSTVAWTAITVELLALTIVAVRRHRTDWG